MHEDDDTYQACTEPGRRACRMGCFVSPGLNRYEKLISSKKKHWTDGEIYK